MECWWSNEEKIVGVGHLNELSLEMRQLAPTLQGMNYLVLSVLTCKTGQGKWMVFPTLAEHHSHLNVLKAQIPWTHLTPAELEFPR